MGYSCLGFPEFTRFFNLPYGRKLQLGMDFPVAVGTKQLALFELFPNPTPASGITFMGNPKVFNRGVQVMDL